MHIYVDNLRSALLPSDAGTEGGFGRSVNPIPTGGGQIIPTYYYWHPQMICVEIYKFKIYLKSSNIGRKKHACQIQVGSLGHFKEPKTW